MSRSRPGHSFPRHHRERLIRTPPECAGAMRSLVRHRARMVRDGVVPGPAKQGAIHLGLRLLGIVGQRGAAASFHHQVPHGRAGVLAFAWIGRLPFVGHEMKSPLADRQTPLLRFESAQGMLPVKGESRGAGRSTTWLGRTTPTAVKIAPIPRRGQTPGGAGGPTVRPPGQASRYPPAGHRFPCRGRSSARCVYAASPAVCAAWPALSAVSRIRSCAWAMLAHRGRKKVGSTTEHNASRPGRRL